MNDKTPQKEPHETPPPQESSADRKARAMLANPKLQKSLAELRAMTPAGEPLFGFPLKTKDAREEVPHAEPVEIEDGTAIVADKDAASAYIEAAEPTAGMSPRMPTGKIRVKGELQGAVRQDPQRQQVTQRSIARGGTGPTPPALPSDPTEETAEPAITSAFTKSTASTAPTVTTKRAIPASPPLTLSLKGETPRFERTFGLSKTSWGIVLAMLSGAVIAIFFLRPPSRDPSGATPSATSSSVAPSSSQSVVAPEVSTATVTETPSPTAIPSTPPSTTTNATPSVTSTAAATTAPTVNSAPSVLPKSTTTPVLQPTPAPTAEPSAPSGSATSAPDSTAAPNATSAPTTTTAKPAATTTPTATSPNPWDVVYEKQKKETVSP